MTDIKKGDVFIHADTGTWYAALENNEENTGTGFKVTIFRPYPDPVKEKGEYGKQ